jgi:hypothetical protein
MPEWAGGGQCPVASPAGLRMYACLFACLPSCRSACLLARLPTCLSAGLPAYRPAYLPIGLPTCLRTCLPTCLPACLFLSCAVAYLYLSSLGTGTYLGNANDMTDEQVLMAILYSATRGWNVIDTGRCRTAAGFSFRACDTQWKWDFHSQACLSIAVH